MDYGVPQRKLYEKWASQWATSEEDNYAHTKMWIPKIGMPPTKGLLKINNRKTHGGWVTTLTTTHIGRTKKNFPNTDKTCRLAKSLIHSKHHGT